MRRIIFLFLLSAVFISCGKKQQTQEENTKTLPFVKVRTIETQQFTETYNVVGVVKPFESATLSAEQGGLITYLRKDKGDHVSRGETVVRINKSTDYASYEQALSQLELAKSNYERSLRLYEQNVITEQEFTNTKLQLGIAESSVNVFESRLTSGSIQSPISGIVNNRFMDKGEVSGTGVPIMEIVNVSQVKINAGIPERYVSDVTRGSKVKITFDVYPGEEFEGTISYISPTLSQANRTFDIEIVINNPSGRLKPEMSANIEVTKANIPQAVVLAQDLIVDYGTEKYVFVLDQNNKAQKRVLILGGRNGNDVLIESGLNPGDKLIYEGYQPLNEGDEVKVLES